IAHGRRNIQPGTMVQIRLRAFVSEDVLEMICAKRAAILPLRITSAIAFANGHPSMAAHRLSRPSVGLFEPRNHQWRFGLELAMGDIIVRQRAVEGILMRDESDWNVIAPRARIRIVGSAIIHRTIEVPRTSVVGDWIIASCLFAN